MSDLLIDLANGLSVTNNISFEEAQELVLQMDELGMLDELLEDMEY